MIDESTKPLAGLGSGDWYESRFLRECIDGGHAGIGHRRRAVGNQDFPRRVNRQEACVEQETSGQEEVRDNGVTSAAAEAFCSSCRRVCRHSSFQRVGVWLGIPSGPRAAFGLKSLMHFSYYLMIAALTLVGFEVIHALYQLAAFVL